MAQSQVADQLSQPRYFPNPVSRDNAVINVTFGNEVLGGDAEIELWNSIGQLVWTKKAALTDGQKQLQVELGNDLNGGMYQLIVRQNGTVNNYRIVVQ
jgi:methionine-rich copper-binding protein CopC